MTLHRFGELGNCRYISIFSFFPKGSYPAVLHGLFTSMILYLFILLLLFEQGSFKGATGVRPKLSKINVMNGMCIASSSCVV